MSRSLPKAKFGFSTKDKYIEFELTVRVSTQFKFFYRAEELPAQLREQVYGERQYFDSFHELEAQVNNLIAEAEISLIEETKTKVILYNIQTNARHGQSIDFQWIVVQKIEISNKKSKNVKYYEETKRGAGYQAGTTMNELSTYHVFGDRDSFHEMAWSMERENWFKNMDQALATMAHRLNIGFGKTPEILARKIDQGAQFLLTGSDQK